MLKRARSLEEPETAATVSAPGAAHVVHRCPEPGCGKQFNRKYTLGEHTKTHTGEKPHVCPVRTCGKRFTTSGNLARHKRLHGFIQPIECPVDGCVCTFPSEVKLEKHMKFHFGGAEHACPVPGCGKTFSTTGNQNRHLRNYHPEHAAAEDWQAKGSDGSTKSSPSGTDEWPAEDGGTPNSKLRRSWSMTSARVETPINVRSQALSSDDDDGGEVDMLDSLAGILEGTGLDRDDDAPVEERGSLFDDIVRFHVTHLGSIDGGVQGRERALTR